MCGQKLQAPVQLEYERHQQMLQMGALADLAPKRQCIGSAWIHQRLRIQLSQPGEVPNNQGSAIGVSLEEEVAFNRQAL